jgi:hypothetical protein
MASRFLFFLLVIPATLSAQIWNGTDTLYGNEWINFSQTYYKIKVSADGIYRIPYQTLADAGFPVNTVAAGQLRLYRYGQQEPVYTSTNDLFSNTDFIEFFGERNRDALDRHLFENPDQENLNPWYSLFNDTTVYYLTWESSGQPLRYTPVPNDLSNLPPKEPFCWSMAGNYYTGSLFKRQISVEVTYSWFNGEGFAANPNINFPVAFAPKKLFADGPDATLSIRYACGFGSHEHRLSWNDSLLTGAIFSGWGIRQLQAAVPAAQIKTSNTARLQSVPGGTDRAAVAGVFLRYPRLFDFENFTSAEFTLDGSNDPKYLEIQAFNASGGIPLLYDVSNRLRLEMTVESGMVKVLLPAAAAERKIWLVNSAKGVQLVNNLQPVQFRDYSAENATYIILSNKALFNDPANNNADYVAEYADYRRSPQGGGHKVSVVDVNELYEQFAYGVRFHPLAARNFVQFIHKKWDDPRYLLIIGKGLDYNTFRTTNAQKLLADSIFFVPTYGAPGADQLLVMREKKMSDPLMAIGRLAVVAPAEIRDYLNKVREHEQTYTSAPQTQEGKAWMKRVIHNSGGLAGEVGIIKNNTQEMADEIAQNRVGAEVYTYYKTSNDPIQLSSYEQMLDLLNGGVSLWMIYGHSSPNAVDFDIGSPAVYDNKGRYPLMMIMGCFSGLCSTPQKGIGEQFVLAPDRGAIAYIASVNFSFIDALKTFGLKYYERLGGADYGQSIGDILKHTVSDLNQSNYSALVALLHQNLLQGDPAIKLHFYPGADYVIDPQSVKFDPNPVSLEQPALKLDFDVVNIGENTGGTLPLRIDQRRPDDQVLNRRTDTITAPPFRQKQTYNLPTSGSQIGFNRFLISLDPQNTVAEQPAAAEFNNELTDATGLPGADVYFFADDVAPVAPYNFGIVRKKDVTLQASTQNFSAAPMRYLFELDTLEKFNSPFKKTGEVFQGGGLLEWKPPVQLQDSTVYYWRVARDSLVNGQIPWRNHSFICLPGSAPGWNQSHFGQYAQGQFVNLQAVDSTRRLEFVDNAGFISTTVAYRNVNRYPGFQNVYYEGFFGDYNFNVQGIYRGVTMMVQDPNTGHIVPNLPGSPYNPTADKKPLFSFDTQDSLQRIALMDFIENQIPAGYVVGLLAFHSYNDTLGYAPRRWASDSVSYGKNLFQVFEAQGAKEVRSLVDYATVPHPYGFIFRKDDPLFDAVDTIVYSIDSAINIRRSFLAKWSVGQFETPAIGPAKAWKSLHWQRKAFDDPSDAVQLSVLGTREALGDTLLFSLQNTFDTTLQFISAAQFPQLKIRYESGDTLKRSATEPGYLRVLYDPVPEGALHPQALYDFYGDTLQQGEPGRVAIAFANVSEADFDSLLVKFRVENENNTGPDYLKRFRPLPSGDTLQAVFDFSTQGNTGKQRLLIDVNPANAQPELYHFNNTAVREFYVLRDVRNPLLDVTFDGQHLLDGDIVSPRPAIVVTLRDENRFLAMSDTATFALKVVYPNGAVQPLSFSDPAVQFFPAQAGDLPKKNLARLEWRPVFTEDGDYRLQVNGRDVSGNNSGALDYAITFRVITKSSISHLLNYPNPFSTSTCFVYTMTGAETPAHFKVQIMTVSGRVVREITEAEFGPLLAGTHTSNYCWNGRDEYGDQLANGVYLYRVVAKKADGSPFEFFENESVDGFFKNGFGKMVLLR